MKTTSVFVYGTLTSPQVVRILLGRDIPAMIPARLDGHSRHPVINRVYPGMLKSSEKDHTKRETSFVNGCILADVTPKEMKLLDWFEADEYERQIVHVQQLLDGSVGTRKSDSTIADSDNKAANSATISPSFTSAAAYIWKPHLADKLSLDEDWSYENFVETHLEAYLVRTVHPCRAEMERLGMT